MSDQNEREIVGRIYAELSDEAKKLVVDVLTLEKENLHLGDTATVTRNVSDQIIRRVEGVVK
ncbi:hypothetical protein FH608_050250 [Nonomuraea phyllanthi]|uniref:Uncharacterized protein n=1 Tax=Nonomuraea phyllanthi TaxID=2219224 RepID=A0A5C4UTW6_9ACTN|nr:hypothetical protein [Nonomuraea phyllanthi]KAB8182364.1 hypothetical protein FH608_050250 [Nonomuraea phyllanthi]